jgi:hypothetical protein
LGGGQLEGSGNIQPGGVSSVFQRALDGTWDTVMYHLRPGRENVNETLFEIYASHQGQPRELIWQQTFPITTQYAGGYFVRKGYQAVQLSTYNNSTNFTVPYYERWTQLVFSRQEIPWPQV